MKRRAFLKSLAATGAATSLCGTGLLTREAQARGKRRLWGSQERAHRRPQ
jgi:hypothetical protein